MATATKPKPKTKRPTVHVTLATFDAAPNRPVYRQVRDAKLKDFAEVTHEDYAPAGMTPLLDATGLFIKGHARPGHRGRGADRPAAGRVRLHAGQP